MNNIPNFNSNTNPNSNQNSNIPVIETTTQNQQYGNNSMDAFK